MREAGKDLIDTYTHTLFCREAAFVARMLRMVIKLTVLFLLGKKYKEEKHLTRFDTKVNSPDV